MAKRNRCKQVQLDRLVDLVENNFNFHSQQQTAAKKVIWDLIIKELNALGPKKTVTEWKQCFRMLKLNTTKKYNILKNGASNVKLTDRDRRVIALCGISAVELLEPNSQSTSNHSLLSVGVVPTQEIETIQETQENYTSIATEIATSIAANTLRVCSICKMEFRVSTELMLHSIELHSAQTISAHLNDLLDNETVKVSDNEYDYTFIMTTTYQRTPKFIVKTELISCEENEPATVTSDERLQGWPLSAVVHPGYIISNSVEIKPDLKAKIHSTENQNDSGISMDESFTSTNIKLEHVTPSRPIRGTKPRARPIRPYSCVMCTRSFDKKRYLHVHMRTHMGNRTLYACDICGKSFKTKSYIEVHKETSCVGFAHGFVGRKKEETETKNKPAKPYACKICGQRFRLKSYVSLHIKIHCLSMGPYDVPVSDDVKVKHEHLPGRPHECNLCHKDVEITLDGEIPMVRLHDYVPIKMEAD